MTLPINDTIDPESCRWASRKVMFDPRAIANLLLDEADAHHVSVSNLALQKLVFFAHGLHLNKYGKPLVSGYFEAWEYGPVHPLLYKTFKIFGAQPITSRAHSIDLKTDQPVFVKPVQDPVVRAHIANIVLSYGSMTPGRLIQISHAKGGPWAYVVEKARSDPTRGLRITDEVIKEQFKNQKISIREASPASEPDEDTPITKYGNS